MRINWADFGPDPCHNVRFGLEHFGAIQGQIETDLALVYFSCHYQSYALVHHFRPHPCPLLL